MHAGPVIAVSDLARAREFYETKLGLAGEGTPGGHLVRGDGDTVIYLLPGVTDADSATWSVASFRVTDARATVRTLRSRGVTFLTQEELPFRLDDDGISSDTTGLLVAWMRDPDGSVLTIFSHTEPG